MSQLGEGNLVTGWIIVVLLGVMAVAILLQPYLILFEELNRRGKPWTLENICSRINVYQLALSLSCVFYLYSIRRLFLENEESESNDLKVYSATSLGLCESFYVLFSWKRSSELVKSQVSSKFATALKYIVHIAPLLYISPGVFLLLKWQKAHNIGLVLNGVLTLTLDGVFATRFLRQMLELRNVNISVPEEFKIISFYGLLSCLFCCLCVACFAATLLMNPIPDSHALPQNAPLSFYITYNLLLVFLVLVASTALVMKWRLGHPTMFARESVQSLVRDFLSVSEKDGAVRSKNPL